MLPSSFDFLTPLEVTQFVPFNCDEPPVFSLQDLRDDEIVQNSALLNLDANLLEKIVQYIPLKERLFKVQPVCKQLSTVVKKSINCAEFFKDGIDQLEDAKLLFFLSQYGPQIEYLNYDLYRSIGKQFTQWSWRQSVIQTVTRCANLKHLDILFCSRHRLRDGDLTMIFKHCHNLETLKIDGQFIMGHGFAKVPQTLRRLEIELCYRFSKEFFVAMLQRLYKLRVLHVSQLFCLERVIHKISEMKNLEQLSIVGDPEHNFGHTPITEFRRMPKLETLCLDGLGLVTDKLIGDLVDAKKSTLCNTLKHLSVAYCRNFGASGLQKLKQFKNLKSLNLDGVSRRDISMGIESIAQIETLERVYLSDDTFVEPECVLNLASSSKNLKLLDISNNSHLVDKEFGKQMIARVSNKLTVLTDTVKTWPNIPIPSGSKIEIVHLYRYDMSLNFPVSISTNGHLQLPYGLLLPDLRRGTRFRPIEQQLVAQGSKEESVVEEHEKENWLNAENFATLDFESIVDPMYQLKLAQLLDQSNLVTSEFMPMHGYPLQHSNDDFLTMLTGGSAGAPEPPFRDSRGVKKSPPMAKYTRANRPQRKARKENHVAKAVAAKAPNLLSRPKSKAPVFTEDDFPPLG